MDDTIVMYVCLGTILLSVICSAIVGYFAATVRSGELSAEFRAVKSQIMGVKSEAGVSARANNEARLEEAVMAIATRVKGGDDYMKALTEVAAAYPDVAMRLAKKGFKF